MADDRYGLDLDTIRSEIERLAPEFRRQPVSWLGEGMDSIAYEAGGTTVFRFPKHDDAAASLRREIALLPHLAPTLPLDVPHFVHFGEHSGNGRPFVGYRRIEGVPLDRPLFDGLTPTTRGDALGRLAAFLVAVHAFPIQVAAGCGVLPHGDRDGYLDDYQRTRDQVLPLLDPTTRREVEAIARGFLEDDANFARVPRLLHGDLWPEHVLVSRADGRLAGIIDFGDVCLGDPDYDLAFLALRLGPDFIPGLLRHYPHDDPARLVVKVKAFALFNELEDVFVGLDRGDSGRIGSGLSSIKELSEAGP